MTDIPISIDILGVHVAPLRKAQLVEILAEWASGPTKRVVSHVNVHAMNLAHGNSRFLSAVNSADLVFCDGHGVKWGAARLGEYIPERLAVMDWLDDFASVIAGGGVSLYLLGDEEGVAEKCGQMLEDSHPGLQVAGTHHGFFKKTGPESHDVVQKINASGANVLMVGFGMPLQEFWIEDHRDLLDVSVILPVGAAFRWYAGFEKRTPRWMNDRGFEWIGRLVRHPIKMFGRYVIGNPRFAANVLSQRRQHSRPKPD